MFHLVRYTNQRTWFFPFAYGWSCQQHQWGSDSARALSLLPENLETLLVSPQTMSCKNTCNTSYQDSMIAFCFPVWVCGPQYHDDLFRLLLPRGLPFPQLNQSDLPPAWALSVSLCPSTLKRALVFSESDACKEMALVPRGTLEPHIHPGLSIWAAWVFLSLPMWSRTFGWLSHLTFG